VSGVLIKNYPNPEIDGIDRMTMKGSKILAKKSMVAIHMQSKISMTDDGYILHVTNGGILVIVLKCRIELITKIKKL
jgi:hypothetical protein